MQYVINTLSILPLRSEPSHRSEMVSQLLFGESYKILESQGEWLKIAGLHDDYPGWIDFKEDDIFEEKSVMGGTRFFCASTLGYAYEGLQNYNLPVGSTLPNYKNKRFKIGDRLFKFYGTVGKTVKPDIRKLFELADNFLGAPYLWGGRNVFGIDCSGLVQVLFGMCGIKLPRDASQQISKGTLVQSMENICNGDLAFFRNKEDKIIHVGIVHDKCNILHASNFVRWSKLDEKGILDDQGKSYTHSLHSIRRIK